MARPLFVTRAYQPFVLCGSNGTAPGGPQFATLGWYRLWLVDEGALEIRSAGSDEVIRLRGPCGIFQPAGDRARVTHARLQGCRVLEFDVINQRRVRRSGGTGLKHAVPRRQPPPEAVWGVTLPVVIPPSHLPGLKALMVFCGDQWWRSELGRARANGRLAEWLAAFAEDHREAGGDAGDWLGQCRAIAAQLMYQGITASKWAQLVGMSRQHFTKRFKVASGVGPGEYLDQLRIDEARRLLATGGIGVKEVAWLCGFRSLSTFSRFFSRLAGQSPRLWRSARTIPGLQMGNSPPSLGQTR